MDNHNVVDLLNRDLEGEHAAIIQYLNHAFAMGEGALACEIEAIAREEMRHLDLLAETIVALGGTPSLERGMMRLGGKAVPDWMKNDVLQEEDAILMYKEHIKIIDNSEISRLLERILSDELSHLGDFEVFSAEAEDEGLVDLRGDTANRDAENINWGIEHEYTVSLQYMYQKYLSNDDEAKKQFEDQAINEMQHMGWLAEKMIGIKGSPRLEHSDVRLSSTLPAMLKDDIQIENVVAKRYEKAAAEAGSIKLRRLFLRMRDHEKYHSDIFGDLLKKEKR